jgi:D-sedoheptulose 7-phosphate isomerase
MTHTERYLQEAADIIRRLDTGAIEQLAERLARIRAQSGRVFFLGVGGGAGNCSHAVNDFRKLAGIECYAPTDNVSELTARANDEGWPSVFAGWLRVSRLGARDALFIMSVGGGDAERNISPNLVAAIGLAQDVGATVLGIVGRDGGHTARAADACVIVPVVNAASVTPHTEAFQAVIWHLLVTHPLLQRAAGKWETTVP